MVDVNQQRFEQPRRILIIDADASFAETLAAGLIQQRWSPTVAPSPATVSELLDNESFEAIVCDDSIPEMGNFSLVRRFCEELPGTQVVVVSKRGSIAAAVDAVHAGASSYLNKPFAAEELLLQLSRKFGASVTDGVVPRQLNEREQKQAFASIVAQSEVMKAVFEKAKRVAQFNTTILITGESGTGKELLARSIHNLSPRRNRPFIAINCGAIPENLMESELFGHKKGAFTDATRDKRGLLEEASGGTVLLDEIGEMPVHLQVKLLRALQEQKILRVGDENLIRIDLRVISATLRNLEDDVVEGRFRDDLYYRLNVVSLHIPALRERPEDIPVLVSHFIKKHNKRLGLAITGAAPDALECLQSGFWKGNVRELENCVERSMVLADADIIDLKSLPDNIRAMADKEDEGSLLDNLADDVLSIKQKSRALEIDLIRRALKHTAGNRTHAAKILEISHRALLYKLKEYGLEDFEKKGS